MTYFVLARKYRPKNFAQMVGQPHVVQAISNALQTKRLHHAYFFTGTRGVGKTTISRILAKSLNCIGLNGQGDITSEPCGLCAHCVAIDQGRFVDYTELDAASNRGVEEVQTLLEQAIYKPVQGRYKVFMIDEVHMLSNTAFNAMLKTLEEPPEYLKFVLATTDPQKVPVTVLSRCLQFNLRPLAPSTISHYLQAILEQENIKIQTGALNLIAQAARGSMRDALSLTDQAISFSAQSDPNEPIQEQSVRQMLGSANPNTAFELLYSLAHANAAALIERIYHLQAEGVNAQAVLQEICNILQQIAILQMVGTQASAQFTYYSNDEQTASAVVNLAQSIPSDEVQFLYSLCLHGQTELGLASDEYAALTMVLLRVFAFKKQPNAAVNDSIEHQIAQNQQTASTLSIEHSQIKEDTYKNKEKSVSETDSSLNGAPQAQTPQMTASFTGNEDVKNNASVTSPPPLEAEKKNLLNDQTHFFSIPVREQSINKNNSRTEQYIEKSPDSLTLPQTPQLQLTREGDFWFNLVNQLINEQLVLRLTKELAQQSQLIAITESCWRLRTESTTLASASNREKLEQILHQTGHAIKLEVEIGATKDTPLKRIKAQEENYRQQAVQLLTQDTFVQQLITQFDAKILPESLKLTPHIANNSTKH